MASKYSPKFPKFPRGVLSNNSLKIGHEPCAALSHIRFRVKDPFLKLEIYIFNFISQNC